MGLLEELLPYYERELGFLREMAGAFAERFPKIGRRLQIEGDQCEDPHVERLLEAFAFMAARIHRKLDDEYPEITEAFMQVLYPHYTRPIPSATILQFLTDAEKTEIAGRYVIPRHHLVLAPETRGVKCQFRTCFETDLWPITVTGAALELAQNSEYLRGLSEAEAMVTLEFTTQGNLSFAALKPDCLRLFLDGPPPMMALLYELILSRSIGVRVSDGSEDPARVVLLPRDVIRQVGFEPSESLLAFDPRSSAGYRLLAEYFAFPEKFMFFELGGLDHPKLLHSGSRLRVQILVSRYGEGERYARLMKGLQAAHFKLGCVPVVNLFRQAGEPVRLSHQQATYPVWVDGRKSEAYEVYAVDSVTRIEKTDTQEKAQVVPAFYSVSHFGNEGVSSFYWYATRKASARSHDNGTDLEIALVDLEFTPVRPEAEVLSLELTCTNRDLPEEITFGGSSGSQEGFSVPNHAVIKQAILLRKPTPSRRPSTKRGLQWRLVSHLALNQLSLASHGREPLQEALGLYNYEDSSAIARQIQGILDIQTRPVTARIPGQEFASFARGLEIALTFDENCFVGSNLYLFASILERFFADFCPPNSFVKCRMFTRQQEGEVAQWPPRAGSTPLI